MRKKKYLSLYYKWVKMKRLPGNSGLCMAFLKSGHSYDIVYDNFAANDDDLNSIAIFYYISEFGYFNGVRQNIVLFMAAMNGEL